MGESIPGFEYAVANPTIVSLTKAEGEGEGDQVKITMNPILFTSGALYQVQSTAIVGAYQCFDGTIHEIYERTVSGKQNNVADTNSSLSEKTAPPTA